MKLAVALIGAPDTGKQELSAAYVEAAQAEGWDEVCISPNVGSILADEYDIAVGEQADYMTNLSIATMRTLGEQRLRQKDTSFIQSGTLIDTLAYSGISTDAYRLGLVSPESEERMKEELQSTLLLAQMVKRFLRYDYVFYLPVAPLIEVPGVEQDVFPTKVDLYLHQVFEAFGFLPEELKGSTDERVAQMIDSINTFEAERVDNEDVAPVSE